VISLRNKITSSILCVFIMCIMTGNVIAQETQNSEPEPEPKNIGYTGWTLGLNLSYVTLDEVAATKQKVGDEAYSLDISASFYVTPWYAVTAGFNALNFDDSAGFSQTVVVSDVFGSEVETVDSDASGIMVYGEMNYIAKRSVLPVHLKAGVGFGSIVRSERSIDDCEDCREEDINLSGGAYATASAYRGFYDDRINIGLNARQYFGGDIKNTVSLTLELFNN